jgi:hypothetical protein
MLTIRVALGMIGHPATRVTSRQVQSVEHWDWTIRVRSPIREGALCLLTTYRTVIYTNLIRVKMDTASG